jgi:hypothetical protein
MNILAFAVLFAIGGALNRLRGSGYEGTTKVTRALAVMNKWWFALVFGFLHGFENVTMVSFEDVPAYAADFNFVRAFICAAALKIAYMVGWDFSEFYGNPAKQKNNFLDFVDPHRFTDRPLLHCTYRMLIRGVFYGAVLALPLQSLWPLAAGLLMAPIYFVCCHVLDHKKKLVTDGVRMSEIVLGGIVMVFSFL